MFLQKKNTTSGKDAKRLKGNKLQKKTYSKLAVHSGKEGSVVHGSSVSASEPFLQATIDTIAISERTKTIFFIVMPRCYFV